MEHNLRLQMHKILKQEIDRGRFVNQRIVSFGFNEPTEEIMDYLEQYGYQLSAIVDNNENKTGQKMKGVRVYTPEGYLKNFQDNTVILIASKYYNEMVNQVENLGYEEKKHIIKAVEYSSYSNNSLEEKTFEENLLIVRRGRKVYERLLQQHSNLQKMIVFPLAVLGDAYLAMSLLQEYLDKNQIQNYILVMHGTACQKITYLFGFEEQTEIITGEEIGTLMRYLIFTNLANEKALIVHHRFPYTCKIGEMGNYKNTNFMHHFKYSIYNLPEITKPRKPTAIYQSVPSMAYVDQLFRENSLVKGMTVILMPYAKTSAKINDDFWVELAKKLKACNYEVCTNCGIDAEMPIEGTKRLFFDIRYALEVVEAAGVVVGLRSGLCDVISTADCKKIILYPDRYYGPDKYIKFFSLNYMEFCKDAIELEISSDMQTSELIEIVRKEIDAN